MRREQEVLAEILPRREVRAEEALDETISLLDLAMRRSRASKISDPELKSLIHGALEAARQEISHLKNATAGPAAETPVMHTGGQTARGSADREGEQREAAGPLGRAHFEKATREGE